ncbi:MAG: hypothetical protein SVO01_00505 [Thermotogota bacterium]|nr:hypothetical protein [Thermotogota bacterium]
MTKETSFMTQYDELPEFIKDLYSFREYMWLSTEDKYTLVSKECEPEDDEDELDN